MSTTGPPHSPPSDPADRVLTPPEEVFMLESGDKIEVVLAEGQNLVEALGLGDDYTAVKMQGQVFMGRGAGFVKMKDAVSKMETRDDLLEQMRAMVTSATTPILAALALSQTKLESTRSELSTAVERIGVLEPECLALRGEIDNLKERATTLEDHVDVLRLRHVRTMECQRPILWASIIGLAVRRLGGKRESGPEVKVTEDKKKKGYQKEKAAGLREEKIAHEESGGDSKKKYETFADVRKSLAGLVVEKDGNLTKYGRFLQERPTATYFLPELKQSMVIAPAEKIAGSRNDVAHPENSPIALLALALEIQQSTLDIPNWPHQLHYTDKDPVNIIFELLGVPESNRLVEELLAVVPVSIDVKEQRVTVSALPKIDKKLLATYRPYHTNPCL